MKPIAMEPPPENKKSAKPPSGQFRPDYSNYNKQTAIPGLLDRQSSALPFASIPNLPKFKINASAERFRRQFFPTASATDWNDWCWQLSHRIRTLADLARVVPLSAGEKEFLSTQGGHLPVGITPYYCHLVSRSDLNDPIRRSVIPVTDELISYPGEAADPLGEEHTSPVPGIVHRYPDRVLFLVTDFCSVYCRYCTRSRLVGGGGSYDFSRSQWEQALDYIQRTPEIRDVLISGGDPLTLADQRLEYLLMRLRAIPHVEIIRIGTKIPAVLPQRITPALVRMLKRYHPLWMSLNFMHPAELTPETVAACSRLANAGIPLGSQTVLLAGINDAVKTLKTLFLGLMKARVRPYYLYQCDPITGSRHFRTPVEQGLEIIAGLQGKISGYALPKYVVDAPGGGGKIPVASNNVTRRTTEGWYLKNFAGKEYFYPDPKPIAAIEQPGEQQ